MSGLPKWPATAWRRLLELALTALDEAGEEHQWRLGGGTALALKLGHRISYDIDIFLTDGELLRALSPNRNKAAAAIAESWQEPGNYIKLEREEGAIDFVLAARLTDLSPWFFDFKGRSIPAEPPAEILAKKLKYRGSRLLPRDVFDILAAQAADPAILSAAVSATPEGARRAADRIRRIKRRYRETIRNEVNPTSAGLHLLEQDPLRAAELLSA